MSLLLGIFILLACLIVGVRYGSLGLPVISGIGLIIYVFVLGYKPGTPPIAVMLTIIAVVTCAGYLQTSGGLTVMLKYAEKFLRSNPKRVTIYAPLTTWLLTILCGTGHVVYTMFPIIYDVAIHENIRPERPMAVASVASQMGISASPVSVALVSMAGFISAAGLPFTVINLLAVSIPATFCGVMVAAIWSYRRGKDLEEDPIFQAYIKDPAHYQDVYGNQTESLQNKELPSSFYRAMYMFFLGIIIIAVLGNFPQILPSFPDAKGTMKAISMTTVIQMIMLVIAAAILIFCKVNAKDVGKSQVFHAGLGAVVCVYGVAWMADTCFSNHMADLKAIIGGLVQAYPWTYALAMFLTSKLVNSQAAAVSIIVPLALTIGVDPIVILSFISACYGYFFLPTYPSDLACINFDRSGTTHIGKYVLNHSFMIPGLLGVFTGCCVGYVIAHILY